ncbi:MAG: DUF1772 domain-containing protein [Woeseiaceae bacterium]|nr:DUF1772 domain-containing protein [Woeseiaceae bacterium]
MDLFQITLLLATLLSALVAGMVLTFAIVVMPGIRTMGDRDYLRAFKVMDRVIQDNQPIFMLVWLGSAVLVLAATVWGTWRLEGLDRIILIVAGVIYIFGVHVPTVAINIPINNQLQAQDLDSASETELRALAETYETRWIRWNTIRTVIAILTTVLLLALLIRA